jgi:hypothetical protein
MFVERGESSNALRDAHGIGSSNTSNAGLVVNTVTSVLSLRIIRGTLWASHQSFGKSKYFFRSLEKYFYEGRTHSYNAHDLVCVDSTCLPRVNTDEDK